MQYCFNGNRFHIYADYCAMVIDWGVSKDRRDSDTSIFRTRRDARFEGEWQACS